MTRLVEQVHAGVGDPRRDDVAVELVAHLERRRRGQSPGVAQFVVQLAERDGSLSTIAMLPAASGDSAASIVTVSWDSLGTASIFSEGA